MKKKPHGPNPSTDKDREYHLEETRALRLHKLFSENERDKRRKYPTWKDLAALTGENRSTLMRTVARMRDQWNMPIDKCPERGGGIGYTEPVTSFPLLVMSQRQAAMLGLAQQLMTLLEGTPMYDDFKDVLRKAFANLPEGFAHVFDQFRAAVSFHTIGQAAPAAPDWDLFSTCIRAVIDKGELELEHCSAKRGAKPKKVVVHPRHVANINHAWYLFFDVPGSPLTDPPMKYALTRIREARRTGSLFKPTRSFNIDAELKTGLGAFNQKKTEAIHVRFDAEAAPFILERRWHQSQTTQLHAEGMLDLKMQVCLAPELDSLLLPWAGKMRVISPDSLRGRMRAYGEALVRDHS